MFSAQRIFRVLRVFKVISGERQMRVILDAIFRAIPGIDWAAGVMALICARKPVGSPQDRGTGGTVGTGGTAGYGGRLRPSPEAASCARFNRS